MGLTLLPHVIVDRSKSTTVPWNKNKDKEIAVHRKLPRQGAASFLLGVDHVPRGVEVFPGDFSIGCSSHPWPIHFWAPCAAKSTWEFSRTLGQRGMMLNSGLLAGYQLVPVIPNDDMEYHIALRSASGSLEVRYTFRADPGGNSFSAFALATLLNVGSGEDALGPFPPQAVKAEFNADRGVSGPFTPRSTFSNDHDSGIMVAIWAEGRGMAYAFYLFNENQRELALAE